jgi:hypothetical protein
MSCRDIKSVIGVSAARAAMARIRSTLSGAWDEAKEDQVAA